MPLKLCECGCGDLTPIAKRTCKTDGRIKGQPARFAVGHHRRFQGTFQERFEQYFEKTPNSCWIWKASKNEKGYGYFGIKTDRAKSAHRVSYELYVEPIPAKLHVLHKCDNPSCVNPEHLFLGTNQDNVNDKVSKGRVRRGESSPRAKLTEESVRKIRNDNRPYESIAKDYGVRSNTISQIKSRKLWKHI